MLGKSTSPTLISTLRRVCSSVCLGLFVPRAVPTIILWGKWGENKCALEKCSLCRTFWNVSILINKETLSQQSLPNRRLMNLQGRTSNPVFWPLGPGKCVPPWSRQRRFTTLFSDYIQLNYIIWWNLIHFRKSLNVRTKGKLDIIQPDLLILEIRK